MQARQTSAIVTEDELAELLAFTTFALTWAGDPMCVYLQGRRYGHTRRAEGLYRLGEGRRHRQLEIGLTGRSTVLWARVKGSDQTRRAHEFRPLPSLVLKEGSGDQRLLLWLLDAPAPLEEVQRANYRLAYRLRAHQRHGVPEELRIPATLCSHHERERPVPLRVTRMELDERPLESIVGRLREPPPRRSFAHSAGLPVV